MKYTPKTIKRALKRCINKISEHPEVFAKNPEKDFTRVRKLPFKQVLKSVLSMTGKSIRGELMDYFGLTPAMPTVSAFVQQRNKIDHRAFESLFHNFTSAVDEQKMFKGYRLLAVDGSDLHTPTNSKDKASFYEGVNGQKSYNLFHLNTLYDIQRKIYVDAIVQESKHENEHRALVTMVDRDTCFVPTIYIADRGYESYNNMAHIIEKKQKFLIRVRDIGRKGIVSGLSLPDKDEFDIVFSFGLTRKQTKDSKQCGLKFIPSNVIFDYLPKTSKKNVPMIPYYISFRLVRFKLTEDKEKGMMIQAIKPIDIYQFIEYKLQDGICDGKGGLSRAAVKKLVGLIRHVLDHAVIMGDIEYNPALRVPIPKDSSEFEGEEKIVFLSAEEAQDMLNAFSGHPLEAIVYVTLYYGLRKSEVLGLKWDAIDFDNNTISIKHVVVKNRTVVAKDSTKSYSSRRTFEILPEVKDLLLKLKQEEAINRALYGAAYKDSDYVFKQDDGTLYRPDSLTRSFQRILARHGLRKMRFHDLRHTTASVLFDKGWDINEIKEWLGHADIETTVNVRNPHTNKLQVKAAYCMNIIYL